MRTGSPDPRPIPTRGPIDATVRVPGSRSITNRALLVAALAAGESELTGALVSDDTEAMRDCLDALGVRIVAHDDVFRVEGRGGRFDAPTRTLFTRASGTTMRFLSAAASLAPGPVEIDGGPRMRERPIQDLVDALRSLGAKVEVLGRAGCPPLRLAGGGIPGGTATVNAGRSSQFLSGLLLAAPYAERDVTLVLADGVLVSRPYAELTLGVMSAFGARARFLDPGTLHVEAGQLYRARTYAIEPDASSAVYPLAAAALVGGRVRVEGLSASSMQPDVAILRVFEQMGCTVERSDDALEVRRPDPTRPLRSIDVDLNDLPDAALTVAVLALFAEGPSTLRGLVTLPVKETDRLAALETELRRLGAGAKADKDTLRIEPKPLRGTVIETYDDHRMAMAFALAGLRIPDLAIANPGCVEKTWPDYFEALERL